MRRSKRRTQEGAASLEQASLAAMPYRTNAELPAPVQAHLPDHAQDIYRAAFNHAYSDHADDPRRDEIAHRIA
jgi:cation transport regulator